MNENVLDLARRFGKKIIENDFKREDLPPNTLMHLANELRFLETDVANAFISLIVSYLDYENLNSFINNLINEDAKLKMPYTINDNFVRRLLFSIAEFRGYKVDETTAPPQLKKIYDQIYKSDQESSKQKPLLISRSKRVASFELFLSTLESLIPLLEDGRNGDAEASKKDPLSITDIKTALSNLSDPSDKQVALEMLFMLIIGNKNNNGIKRYTYRNLGGRSIKHLINDDAPLTDTQHKHIDRLKRVYLDVMAQAANSGLLTDELKTFAQQSPLLNFHNQLYSFGYDKTKKTKSRRIIDRMENISKNPNNKLQIFVIDPTTGHKQVRPDVSIDQIVSYLKDNSLTDKEAKLLFGRRHGTKLAKLLPGQQAPYLRELIAKDTNSLQNIINSASAKLLDQMQQNKFFETSHLNNRTVFLALLTQRRIQLTQSVNKLGTNSTGSVSGHVTPASLIDSPSTTPLGSSPPIPIPPANSSDEFVACGPPKDDRLRSKKVQGVTAGVVVANVVRGFTIPGSALPTVTAPTATSSVSPTSPKSSDVSAEEFLENSRSKLRDSDKRIASLTINQVNNVNLRKLLQENLTKLEISITAILLEVKKMITELNQKKFESYEQYRQVLSSVSGPTQKLFFISQEVFEKEILQNAAQPRLDATEDLAPPFPLLSSNSSTDLSETSSIADSLSGLAETPSSPSSSSRVSSKPIDIEKPQSHEEDGNRIPDNPGRGILRPPGT